MKPVVLQLCPFMQYLETSLLQSFDVHRFHELTDQGEWLRQHGDTVLAVVTGGHLGLSNELSQQLPNLQIVAINGVGIDKVDLPLARARGYRVTNTPDVLTDDVADLAVGLSIALLRGVVAGHAVVSKNAWPGYEPSLGRKIAGMPFGILGFGRIGRAVAQRLEGFKARIGYCDSIEHPVAYARYPDVTSLAIASDVLIVAVSAGAANDNLINRDVLTALGPTGFLVNIARGSLVDEDALIEALSAKRLGGAALDVFRNEPRVPIALQHAPNVILTPHIASATVETRTAMAQLVLDNLHAHFARGHLLTAVV